MYINQKNLHKKRIRPQSLIAAKKSMFPFKPDRRTNAHIDRRTDIYDYRVALLLKIFDMGFCNKKD